jgi:hypothetical protein
LRHEERAAQVRVQDEVPVVPGDVGGALADVAAGVVHEHVDPAVRIVRGVRHQPDALGVADVQRERDGAAAAVCDLLRERTEAVDVPAGDDEVRAGMRQRAGECLAEAAARARDDRDAAGQVEEVVRHARESGCVRNPRQKPTPFAFTLTRIR